MELVQNPRTLILGKKETDDDVKVFLDIVQLEPVSFVLLSDKFWRRRTKFFVAAAVPDGLAHCCCQLVKPTAAAAAWFA